MYLKIHVYQFDDFFDVSKVYQPWSRLSPAGESGDLSHDRENILVLARNETILIGCDSTGPDYDPMN